MKKSSCHLLLPYYPKISNVDDLHSTYIANGVFNSFLSFTAIMLNIVTIHAIRKTPSLPKTLRTLLLSLAASDLGVGLCVQPFFTSLLVKWLQQNIPNCITYKAFFLIALFFSAASFSGVVAVTVDRFFAIHLHLRYQELVTHKRVAALMISTWLLSALIFLTSLWVSPDIRSLYQGIIIIVGLLLTTVVYIRIYLVVRRHKNQIQALQVQQAAQTDEMANFASIIKTAVGMFYVYLVFLFCYLPYFISLAAIKIFGSTDALKRLHFLSYTLIFFSARKIKKTRHLKLHILK